MAALLLGGGSTQGLPIFPIYYPVTQTGDSGPGSLREGIASTSNVIVFKVTGAITLTSGPLVINRNLTISGPNARKLKVMGNVQSIFEIDSGTVDISGLTIGPAGQGSSGIFIKAGTADFENCTVSGNSGGGIFTVAGSTLNMSGCTISGNQLSVQGGAGLQNDGTATLTNCTISGNLSLKNNVPQIASGIGGGLSNNGGILTLNSCTVTGNNAASIGGGIQNMGGTFQLSNTIVAGNTAPTGPDCSGTFVSNGYNLIGIKDGSSGFINGVSHDLVGTFAAPRNALLGPFQDNGGETNTVAITSASSPAVNAANAATAPARDQRNYVRPNAADMGAVEFNGTQPVVLANISSRVQVLTGDNVLFGGLIITGTQQKKVIFRALGPSLNLAGKLANPTLELYNSANQLIASNDNWVDAPNKQAIIDSTIPPTNDFESAILMLLDPGNYTAIVRGVGGATGLGVIEVYDLDRTVNSRLANISTRAFVQTGDNVLIGGFIVLGPDSLQVIIRAIGPSLNVPQHLLDPFLELHDGNGTTIAMNDNWRSSQEAAINATGIPPTNNAESAIVRTLTPGNYTAIVTGVNNTTGVALVEVYGLQ